MPRFTGRVHRRSTKSFNSQRLYYPLCADPILDAAYFHHITHLLLCTCTENDTLSFRLCDLNHEDFRDLQNRRLRRVCPYKERVLLTKNNFR